MLFYIASVPSPQQESLGVLLFWQSPLHPQYRVHLSSAFTHVQLTHLDLHLHLINSVQEDVPRALMPRTVSIHHS